MENVTDALYMAFAALAFVLALSISIGAFSQVTAVSQYIVDTRDRETEYTYVKYQDSGGNLETNRVVRAETIVPTLYRAYEENYIVRFCKKVGDTKTPINILDITRNGVTTSTNEVNLRKLSIGNRQDADEFVTALLNGTISTNNKFNISIKTTDNLPNGKLYDIINGKSYIETLGIYYEDDLKPNQADDVNKTEVRVITYTET